MRKRLVSALLAMCVCAGTSLAISIERLPDAPQEAQDEVKACEAKIIDFVESTENTDGDTIHITADDIDWSQAYRTYSNEKTDFFREGATM